MRRHRHGSHKLLFILVGAFLLLSGHSHGDQEISDQTEAANAVGVVIGAPQTVAVTYGRSLSPHLQLIVHAGSVVLFSSAGARVQIEPWKKTVRPYAFAGYAVIRSTAEDYGDPSGISGYFWLGPGAGLCARRWTLFAEICALLGGDEDRGLGARTWIFPFDPAVSGGLLFRF